MSLQALPLSIEFFPPKTPEAGTKPGADKDTSGAEAGRKGARKGKGALFRVGEDGALEQLHALTQTYFTAVAVGADGVIYAGAADKGRIAEQGSHAQLLAQGGLYAGFWNRQSGGFIHEDEDEETVAAE